MHLHLQKEVKSNQGSPAVKNVHPLLRKRSEIHDGSQVMV